MICLQVHIKNEHSKRNSCYLWPENSGNKKICNRPTAYENMFFKKECVIIHNKATFLAHQNADDF